MRSCIYEGYTEHTRFKPAKHHFRYPLYFYCFDLSELSDLNRNLPLFGYNRFRPTSLYDDDYLAAGKGTIREKLLRVLEKESYTSRIERIFLITSTRYFNYIFNPVSFYYCLSREDDLLCVIAEVNNTFGEKHIYILSTPVERFQGYMAHYFEDKAFHVSPFNNMAGKYEFLFSELGNQIDIRINLHRDDEKIFEAQLWGQSKPLLPLSHLALLLKHPIMPHLSIPRIFWEAARLYFRKRLQYFDKPIPISAMTVRRKPPGVFQRVCMNIVTGLFHKIKEGNVKILLPDTQTKTFGDGVSNLQGEIIINDYRFFSSVVLGGDVGLGEAYMDGVWITNDIPALFRVFIRNRDVFENGYPATAWLKRRKNDLLHMMRDNTLRGARKNIRSHYDLSTDFFRLFLDSSMTYSCGIYRSEKDSLEDAQLNKLKLIVEKGAIKETDEVLEIGCGWGSFAVQAAKQTGCRITGITVSEAQHQFSTDRIRMENLQNMVTILLKDYREIDGLYDKIVSIEMLESVGERYFGSFFQRCDRLLKPGGLLVIQVITIPDQRYESYRKETDWIQKHIFPGGLLPSVTVISSTATKYSSLLMDNLEDIGHHYAYTLKDWRDRFVKNMGKLNSMGFDHSFQRKWEYYLAICEAGFTERALGDVQIVFRKPS